MTNALLLALAAALCQPWLAGPLAPRNRPCDGSVAGQDAP